MDEWMDACSLDWAIFLYLTVIVGGDGGGGERVR